MKNNWQEVKVIDVFSFLRSHAFSRENLFYGILSDGQIGNIHYGDIHANYKSSKIDLKDVEIPIVKDKKFLPSNDDLLIDGDLVMVDASEDYEGVSKIVLLVGIGRNKVVGGLHTFVLRGDKKTDKFYRQYIFTTPEIKKELKRIATGVSVYGVSKSNLAKLKINLPPIEEQGRIVRVLECWDGYLEKLWRKIEVKKNIKKALMQKLLTGDKRLAGFSDKWQTVKLGDVSEITTGSSNREDSSLEGEYTFFDRSEDVRSSNIYLFDGEAVIVAGEGQGFVPKYFVGKFDLHQRTYAIMNFKNADGKFIYYYLNQYKNYLLSQAVGSTVKSLRLPMFVKMSIKLPKLEEQKVIAEILIKADDEITALEKKKKIVEAQKKYLLNNLVTGNILTPENL